MQIGKKQSAIQKIILKLNKVIYALQFACKNSHASALRRDGPFVRQQS